MSLLARGNKLKELEDNDTNDIDEIRGSLSGFHDNMSHGAYLAH